MESPSTSQGQKDAVEGLSQDTSESGASEIHLQENEAKYNPLRATATPFRIDPACSSNVDGSSTTSHPESPGLAESNVFSPQPTLPTDVAQHPIQHLYHGFGHAHNISFHPPPPVSSNDPSSPTRSHYQGYTYTPNPCDFPLQTLSFPQHFEAHRPPAGAFTSRVPGYMQPNPYYGSNPQFLAFGSQAPLTPSATPLDGLPEQWNLPNGYPLALSDQAGSAESQTHYRSSSHSTVRSDDYLSRDTAPFDGPPQPLPNQSEELEQWRSADLDVMQNARSNGLFDEAPLAEHLLLHFNNPDYADCKLVLVHKSNRFPMAVWSLSTILIIQSRKLREILRTSPFIEGGRRILEIALNDRFVNLAAMDYAFRVLYGLPPGTFKASPPSDSCNRKASEISTIRMTESLAFAASGQFLQLKDIVSRGLQVASEILNWGNLEAALSFGLEGDLTRNGDSSSANLPASSVSLIPDSESSPSTHLIFTPSSSSGLGTRQSDHPSTNTSTPNSKQRPPPQSAWDLLSHCLDFIVNNFPTSWQIDLSARPLADVDRLPVTAESRSPLSKSRLSRIQFGDHPSEATVKSNDHHVLLSTILFSLPFFHLKYLFESVGEPMARNISSIIRERERRRHIFLQGKNIPWRELLASRTREWTDVGYEESVTINDNGQATISREQKCTELNLANGE